MTKKKTKNQSHQVSPVPDLDYSTPLTPDTGRVKEAGYGKSIDFELASFESTKAKKEAQGIDAALYQGNKPETSNQNLEFANMDNPVDNQGNNVNKVNASLNKQDQLQAEYAAELADAQAKNPAKLNKE